MRWCCCCGAKFTTQETTPFPDAPPRCGGAASSQDWASHPSCWATASMSGSLPPVTAAPSSSSLYLRCHPPCAMGATASSGVTSSLLLARLLISECLSLTSASSPACSSPGQTSTFRSPPHNLAAPNLRTHIHVCTYAHTHIRLQLS